MAKVSYNNKNNLFYTALKRDIDQYFSEKKIKKTGNSELYIKTLVLFVSAVGLYCFLVFGNAAAYWKIGASAVLGAVLASIGFNIMHDACHGAYSQKKWVNDLLGLSLNALGGNAFIWKFKHNIIHHTYTNVDGMDDDIAKSPLMRQAPTQKWVPAHRFQHIYVVLVYAISSFAWVFIMDFNKYLKKKVNTTVLQKMTGTDHAIFWISKVLYILFYIVIPVYMLGWGPWAIGFAIMHVIMGLTLALVFQLAHVVEEVQFEYSNTEDAVQFENSWAEHQVQSTANFAPKSWLVNWYVGGLNYQVEHHLFPRISHVHYPAMSPIVRKHCEAHGLPYRSFPTMAASMVSHFKMMKKLGEKP